MVSDPIESCGYQIKYIAYLNDGDPLPIWITFKQVPFGMSYFEIKSNDMSLAGKFYAVNVKGYFPESGQNEIYNIYTWYLKITDKV